MNLTAHLSRTNTLHETRVIQRKVAICELRQHADDLETKARRVMAIAMAARAAANLAEMELQRDYERRAG